MTWIRLSIASVSMCVSVSVSTVRGIKRKWLELSTPKVIRDIVHCNPYACTEPKVKNQKSYVCVGLCVDMTAQFST